MGVYDSVVFRCPFCGIELDFQSKAGECALEVYTLDQVPYAIAKDIESMGIWCVCGKTVGLRISRSSFVKMDVRVEG